MSIAYCIMAHQRPSQFLRLLKAIYHPDNHYMLHVDLNETMKDMAEQLARDNHNIHVLPSRRGVWGSWSLVQIELDAIRELLRIGANWTHYIPLSGQDFPLVSQRVLHDVLYQNVDASFVRHEVQQPIEYELRNGMIYGVTVGKVQALAVREKHFATLFPGMALYGGSQWKVLSRAAAVFADSSDQSRELQAYMSGTFIPDETFFQTLLGNHASMFNLVNEHKWAVAMQSYDGAAHLKSPRILTMEDVVTIMTGPSWFARKFDEEVDSTVLDVLERIVGVHGVAV